MKFAMLLAVILTFVFIDQVHCWSKDPDKDYEQYLKTSWSFCRLQKKSEEVQDSNTGWLYCAEGGATGGGIGFYIAGPLGSGVGALLGCVGFALNQSVLRKAGGSESGDSHDRELNCMKEQIARYPIIVHGRPRVAQMAKKDLQDLLTKCPDESRDTTGPCEASIKAIWLQQKRKQKVFYHKLSFPFFYLNSKILRG